MSHLGARISALVDGELGHEARDRALAHVTRCAQCRAELEAERAVKERMSRIASPAPSDQLLAMLLTLGEPGDPMPPRSRRMPLAPLVPTLPPPGRRGSGAPRGRGDSSGPGGLRAHRVRYVAVGALSVAGLMFGTAFAAGGPAAEPGPPVLPPTAQLDAEHVRAPAGAPLRDPALDAVTASFGGLTLPGAAPGTPGR